MKKVEKVGYMCSTAFYDELGETDVVLSANPQDIGPCVLRGADGDPRPSCYPVKVRIILEEERESL